MGPSGVDCRMQEGKETEGDFSARPVGQMSGRELLAQGRKSCINLVIFYIR